MRASPSRRVCARAAVLPLVVAAGLLGASPSPPGGAPLPPVRPAPAGARPSADEPAATLVLDLPAMAWTRDGRPFAADVEPAGHGPLARLAFPALGTRWATTFETDGRATFRLVLHAEFADDGLLFEVVLDGERVPPPRDGWRPARRAVTLDLGPRWLGAGSHLLEFVAREQRDGAVLRLRALEGRELR